MATALAIITDAMQEIGAYAPGETISSAHQALGLLRFQNQLDAWQADDIALNLQEPLNYSLTSGVNTFTIGPSGNLVATRPTFVNGMTYIIPSTTPSTEVPMAPMDNDQYMAISQKSLSSSLPRMFYYNATATNGTMFVWPTVNQTVAVVVYVDQGIDIPATIATSVVGPQGYAEAFMYNLALRLCGPMMRPVPPQLPTLARQAYATMARPNIQPGLMPVDPALSASLSDGGAFNILTGQFSGPSNR